MPIKSENASKYPPEWPEIRRQILVRAGGRCEFLRADGSRCNAPHRTLIARSTRDAECWWLFDEALNYQPSSAYYDVVVVLTIAHLDHNPEHNDEANLLAGCQLHHLRYDIDHHQANAAATRRLKKCNGELFPDLTPQPVEVDTSLRPERI